jgi:hypothetical protein
MDRAPEATAQEQISSTLTRGHQRPWGRDALDMGVQTPDAVLVERTRFGQDGKDERRRAGRHGTSS